MANSTRKWQRRTADQWKVLLERQAVSGQSIEVFCRNESITTASFYRWRKQLPETAGVVEERRGDSSPEPAFVDLGALGSGGGGWELELALGGGVVLRLRGG
jgi:putative transposase